MILRYPLDLARTAFRQVRETGELVASLAWFLADHVRRRASGRPSLLDEAFGKLDFDLVAEDVLPPYDDRDRANPAPRPINGKDGPK